MKPIGILGGGQLAQMLVLEAHRMNLPVAVLSLSEGDPARQVTGNWVQGDPNKLKDLVPFMKNCSSVTFESEFYSADAIEEAAKKTKTPVWPRPETMALLQDRLTQKNLFDKYELPTAQWRPVDSNQDAIVAYVALDGKVVFKKRQGGYDGYGTFIVKSDSDLGTFANDGIKGSFIAEKLIQFKRELAVIAVRDQAGAIFFFPFVESLQKNARCLSVQGPLKETRAMNEMKKSIARFLNGIDYVGAMGIEMFETSRGLLVNEIAPRVHNSGHYTMDAFSLSQFALHLRAVSGLRSQGFSIPTAPAFAMWNLLGSEGTKNGDKNKTLSPWNAKPLPPTAKFHWYGKSESRPGRKMGHINATGKNPATALTLAKKSATQITKETGL